jgi:hypothetical protein
MGFPSTSFDFVDAAALRFNDLMEVESTLVKEEMASNRYRVGGLG